MFVKSILDRLSLLESRFKEISTSNDAVQSLDDDTVEKTLPTQEDGLSFLFLGLIVFLSVLIQIGSYGLYVYGFNEFFLSISILWPLPVGFIVGLSLRGVHLKKYIGLGLTVGFISLIGNAVIYKYYLYTEGQYELYSWTKLFLQPLFVYVLGAASLFTVGGLIGDLMERKQYPDAVPPIYAEKIASKLLGSSPRGRGFRRRLSLYSNAIITLLTLALSMLSTFYNYHMFLDLPKK